MLRNLTDFKLFPPNFVHKTLQHHIIITYRQWTSYNKC